MLRFRYPANLRLHRQVETTFRKLTQRQFRDWFFGWFSALQFEFWARNQDNVNKLHLNMTYDPLAVGCLEYCNETTTSVGCIEFRTRCFRRFVESNVCRIADWHVDQISVSKLIGSIERVASSRSIDERARFEANAFALNVSTSQCHRWLEL